MTSTGGGPGGPCDGVERKATSARTVTKSAKKLERSSTERTYTT